MPESGDRLIYVVQNHILVAIQSPLTPPSRPNFLITWKGLDWSGFRALKDCRVQLENELIQRPDAHEFAVVER